jgi:hypothetical protein
VRPCFAGDNDFMTMSAIVGGKIEKPSDFRKDLPPALEAIMMKALARRAADRYQSADELRIALEQFAVDAGLRTSTTALADYMKSQFGTKALPWHDEDDEDEPEISLHGEDLAIPSAAPVHQEDDDDDLSVPVEAASVRAPTLPMRSLDMRAPAQVIVGAPSSIRVDHARPRSRIPQLVGKAGLALAARNRKLWLLGSVLAVIIAALSLIIVSTGHNKPTPRASITPASRPTAPRPLDRPTVTTPAVVEQAQPEVTPPPKKPAKRVAKPKTPKKWDPDALFPQ